MSPRGEEEVFEDGEEDDEEVDLCERVVISLELGNGACCSYLDDLRGPFGRASQTRRTQSRSRQHDDRALLVRSEQKKVDTDVVVGAIEGLKTTMNEVRW